MDEHPFYRKNPVVKRRFYRLSPVVERLLGVLNKLESHLGCFKCRGPLTDGRCPECQPGENQ